MLELIERLKRHSEGNRLYTDLSDLQARLAVGRMGETGVTEDGGTTWTWGQTVRFRFLREPLLEVLLAHRGLPRNDPA
jgi:hypothetical protein